MFLVLLKNVLCKLQNIAYLQNYNLILKIHLLRRNRYILCHHLPSPNCNAQRLFLHLFHQNGTMIQILQDLSSHSNKHIRQPPMHVHQNHAVIVFRNDKHAAHLSQRSAQRV